jgi:hypothetical protein
MLALLAEPDMFENRIHGFVPNLGAPPINTALLAAARGERFVNRSPIAVQIEAIYKAAKNRAIEDYEIDKLFNPEFYDYQI